MLPSGEHNNNEEKEKRNYSNNPDWKMEYFTRLIYKYMSRYSQRSHVFNNLGIQTS